METSGRPAHTGCSQETPTTSITTRSGTACRTRAPGVRHDLDVSRAGPARSATRDRRGRITVGPVSGPPAGSRTDEGALYNSSSGYERVAGMRDPEERAPEVAAIATRRGIETRAAASDAVCNRPEIRRQWKSRRATTADGRLTQAFDIGYLRMHTHTALPRNGVAPRGNGRVCGYREATEPER